MSHNYNPVFHRDGSITYWKDSYGWIHRVHPSKIHVKTIAQWRTQDRKKWALAMLKRGFVKRNNVWVPQHSAGEA